MTDASYYTVCIGVMSHNKSIVDANLRLSPDINSGRIRLEEVYDSSCAGAAYNAILDRTTDEVIIFAHHDVYFPRGWKNLLHERLNELNNFDPNWAILTPFGMGKHDQQLYGPIWSSSLGSIVGRVALNPVEATSIDESVIIIRRDSGVRFDVTLPGFHLYGTDIVQTAIEKKQKSYVMSLPMVHNDSFKPVLDNSFSKAFEHQHKKWRKKLPIATPVTTITKYRIPFFKDKLRNRRWIDSREKQVVTNKENPEIYASLCGWRNLSAYTEITKSNEKRE